VEVIDMEIQQLKGFLAVAKHGSFSQAARKTYLTQPAISLQVKALENELETRLFDRLTPRKVILTNEGKALFELASPLLDNIETLQERFNEARGKTQKGVVRIATHTSVMVHLLPEAIKSIKKKFPQCEISVVNRDRTGILNMLKNGEVGLGITSLPTMPSGIDYKVFARYERVLIAAKGHPLSKKSLTKPEDIVTYPLILPPLGSNTRGVIDAFFKQRSLKYKIAMEITGKEAIKTYVKMGLGVAIINGFYLSKEDKKDLFVRNMGKYFGEAERGVLTNKNRHLSLHAKKLIDMLIHA